MKINKFLLGLFSVGLLLVFSCQKKLILSNDNSINTLKILEGSQDITSKIVSLKIATEADVSGSYPIKLALPAGTQLKNIRITYVININAKLITNTNLVIYSENKAETIEVQAQNGANRIYSITITLDGAVASHTDKKITRFDFTKALNTGLDKDYVGTIDNSTFNITFDKMPLGTDITNLKPTIEVSDRATVKPASNAAHDFRNDRIYTVEAEDKSTQNYTVKVTKVAPRTAKEITRFDFTKALNTGLDKDYVGTIDNSRTPPSITFDPMPYGIDLTNLKPTIGVSDGATIEPGNENPQDFSSDKTYEVKAEDGTTQNYVVTVSFKGPTVTFSGSMELIVNPSDNFIVPSENKGITATTNGVFAQSFEGITLTEVDNSGTTITTDVKSEVVRDNDKTLTIKIKAMNAQGTTAGSKFKIAIAKEAFIGETGDYTTQSTELILKGGTIWSARSGHTSVIDKDGNIFVMGGETYSYFRDVWKSEDKGLTWNLVTDQPEWFARTYFSSVVDNTNAIYVICGYIGEDNFSSEVWKSNSGGVTWTKLSYSSYLTARAALSSVIDNAGNIYNLGGLGSSFFNDVIKSSDNGMMWNKISGDDGAPWGGRGLHSSVIDNQNNIYVIGGLNSVLSTLNDVWKSNSDGTVWTDLKATGLSVRRGHSSVIDNNNIIYVMGGSNRFQVTSSTTLNDVLKSIDGQKWTVQNASALWPKRYSHTTVIDTDGNFYLMGGFNGGTIYYNDVWKSTDKGITWVRLW